MDNRRQGALLVLIAQRPVCLNLNEFDRGIKMSVVETMMQIFFFFPGVLFYLVWPLAPVDDELLRRMLRPYVFIINIRDQPILYREL